MIKSIFFDFDGVIIESAGIKTAAFRKLFAGYPEQLDSIVNYHLRYMGVSRYEKFRYIYRNILGLPLSQERERELGEEFSGLVLDEVLAVPFVPGALEFLEEYHRKFSFFIVSGTPGDELKEIVRRRGIGEYFQEIHGSPPGKKEIVPGILDRFELLFGEAVFVGDAESDYEAARSTGLAFICRRSSETSEELLEKCPYWLDDLRKLGALLEAL